MALTFNIRGFEVLTAYSGKEAFEILKTKAVDIVLSDVRMNNGSGVDLVKWIREAKFKVPVVAFMSGYADITPKEIVDLDIAFFFDKPFAVNTVIKTLLDRLQNLKK